MITHLANLNDHIFTNNGTYVSERKDLSTKQINVIKGKRATKSCSDKSLAELCSLKGTTWVNLREIRLICYLSKQLLNIYNPDPYIQ